MTSPLFTRTQWRSHQLPSEGTLWVLGDVSVDDQLLRIVREGAELVTGLATVHGHFAAVVVHHDSVLLIADPLRSFPLFYSADEDEIHFGDNATALHRLKADFRFDVDSRIELRHSAFVAGANTLYQGVKQVQAGEVVVMDVDGSVHPKFYRQIRFSERHLENEAEVDAHFTQAFETSMSRFVAAAAGRQVVVPLSGGLDSRLLASYLKNTGYSNVLTFSYGIGHTREVQISKDVAKTLSLPWILCLYQEDQVRQAWASEEAGRFIEYSHSGSALPHVQDWYAVRWLKEQGHLDVDAIFLPGHTIVGNMHDQQILEEATFSREQIKSVILNHHYNVQVENATALENVRLNATADSLLDQIDYDSSVHSRVTALEYFNFRERQTKYINNSVRTYEFFGYDWALPMLDREVYLAWGDFNETITRDRVWYERFVNRYYAQAGGTELRTFSANDVPVKTRETVKKILKSVGLLQWTEGRITARAVGAHPMGLNWFATQRSAKSLNSFSRKGGNLLGAFADEFLIDHWNENTNVFTNKPPLD